MTPTPEPILRNEEIGKYKNNKSIKKDTNFWPLVSFTLNGFAQ
jgi:hypothetical protein